MIAYKSPNVADPAPAMAFIPFLASSIQQRRIILALALRSFHSRFIGTWFGAAWSVISPLVTVLVYWVVFSFGFKATGPQNTPFVVYFMPGFLAWSFVTEALINSASSIVGSRHLVKKMVFPTEILPIVEIVASTFTHLILMGFTILLLLGHGVIPGIWSIQLLYAYFCAATLTLGLGWILSAVNVFHRDVALLLTTVLNVWFWMTPIVWSVDMVPESWQPFLTLNPMFHVMEAYRVSLIYDRPVWSDVSHLIPFWGLVALLLVGGGYVFRRLKPEFADLL
jgi:lipopolysaccharide transport system permease protein/teichoic acid transport system permease protein